MNISNTPLLKEAADFLQIEDYEIRSYLASKGYPSEEIQSDHKLTDRMFFEAFRKFVPDKRLIGLVDKKHSNYTYPLPKHLSIIYTELYLKTGKLNLGNCGLRAIPSEVEELPWLEELILSDNAEWTKSNQIIIRETFETESESLNRLSTISHHISALKQLKKLILAGTASNKWEIEQIENLEELYHLEILDLSYNKIKHITNINRLSKLQQIYLSHNEVTAISGIDKNINLTRLYLTNNKVQKIENLQNNTSLTHLLLGQNYIEKIHNLSPLVELTYLDLHLNRINRIENLHANNKLEYISLSFNFIKKIENIEYNSFLKTLDLNKNSIDRIENLEANRWLETLNLSNNRITKIENLNSHQSLSFLKLRANEITKIENLENLINLQYLDLGANKIEKLENLNTNPHLQFIFLISNKISTIENLDGLVEAGRLSTLDLRDNPITNYPAETIDAGWAAIKERWIYETQLTPFNHIKCLLLGNANIGKSWLLHYFLKNKLPKKSVATHGITYQQLDNLIPNSFVHIWDFGGQEYFHATHKLFFSPNSLSIVLWSKSIDHRDTDNPDTCFELSYWLRCIEQLTKDERLLANEVIVCENKIDKNNYTATKINQEIYGTLFEKLNLHFTNISLSERKRLHGFKELVVERGSTLMSKQPPKYLSYYKKLVDSKLDCIDLAQLKEDQNESFKTALKVFHNMGILLYFHTIIPDKVFIQPQKLLDLLYKQILKSPSEYQLSTVEIERRIKGNYLGLTSDDVIKLLTHFDLVFKIREESELYFIPQYLPDEAPLVDFFKRYHFSTPNIIVKSDSYLMNIVLLKLFARFGKSVKHTSNKTHHDYLFWKNGLVIEQDQQIVLLNFDRQEQAINLYADQNHTNLDLQKQVVSFITRIPLEEMINGDNSSEQPGSNEAELKIWSHKHFTILLTVDNKFYVSYESLLTSISEGAYQVRVNTLNKEEKLLSKNTSVFDFNKYIPNNQKGRMKKIFISYSKDDLKLVNKFLDHLAALKLDGRVATWYCTELKAGGEWNEEIRQNFANSDIVCFLVSSNFMRTPYIHEYEVAEAFKRREKDEKFRIVPIILDFCSWKTKKNDLSQFTALPFTAKPVADFRNQNMAWYIIEECLKLIIDEDEQPYTVTEKGETILSSNIKFPKDVLRLFERIIEGKVDA